MDAHLSVPCHATTGTQYAPGSAERASCGACGHDAGDRVDLT